jgi:hypothetical protein|tara:strand:+ start:2539 stop:3738 length:1200 start_codon:yes stop_codon:yes gene_type:complete
MESNFNIVRDVGENSIKYNNPNNSRVDDEHEFNVQRYDTPVKINTFESEKPKLSINNDSLGLDMLINNANYGRKRQESDSSSSEKDTSVLVTDEDESEDGSEGGETESTESEEEDPGDKTSFYKQKHKSASELKNEKLELLYQFDRMEKKGMKVPKKFSMESKLSEMKSEFDRIRRDKEVDMSIAFQRKMMLACVTGVEFINTKFDPFDVKLEGWSESIHESADDYDDVFEELHHKYKSKSKMAPELKLLMSLGGSAFMFHLTNTMFKTSLPQMGDVLKQNPDLMRQFASATANTMASSGTDKTGMSGMFANMFGGNGSKDDSFPFPKNSNTTSQMNATMNGPSGLDDLLNSLDADENRLETMSTATQSEISELTDTNSIKHLLTTTRTGKKIKKSLNI